MPDTDVPAGYPSRWEADALLSDGSTVHIRPVRPDDAAGIDALHERLSEETVYLRFFSPLRHLTDALLERFTHVDYVDRLALVAELGDRIIAVARYDRLTGQDDAEVAFVVDDALQGRGIGTLLLEHLAAAAKHAGIRRFVADTLPGNARMLGVFRDAGFGAERRFADGVIRVSFPVAPTEESMRAAWERERVASARSVARLLSPATVAVVGASRRPDSVGGAVFRHLLAGAFGGTLHPVHRYVGHVAGVKAYRTVQDVPDSVDLAVVVVPASDVTEVVEQCGNKRVGGLVILSAGFAETGRDGAALERQMVMTARRHGMRVIGPNCMGIANMDPAVSMNATLSPVLPGAGPVGLMAQAGALGVAILEEARARGLGISTFVSAGNKADVSGNDLLNYWEQDPGTQVILLYLESFGNPRSFSRIARRVSRTKPIVVVKGGRSRAGSRAAASHTGATSSPEAVVEALFRQTGVIRVDSLHELLDVGQALAAQPLPAGRRVAIVGNAGGPGVIAADACDGAGLVVPDLSAATRERIGPLLGGAKVGNPVNLDSAAPPHHYEEALAAVLDDPGVDAALAVFVPPVVVDTQQMRRRAAYVAAAIARAAAQPDVVAPKPVLANFLAVGGAPDALRSAGDGRSVPSYAFPESAAHALARMAGLTEWRARPAGVVPAFADVDRGGATGLASAALERGPRGAGLDEAETWKLLGCYGIRPAPDQPAPVVLSVHLEHDPSFGPVISVTPEEAAGPRPAPMPRVLPLTDVDAHELVDSSPLAGEGGADALADLLLRLAGLAEDVPEVDQADLRVSGDGRPVGAAVVVAAADPRPELAVRRLR